MVLPTNAKQMFRYGAGNLVGMEGKGAPVDVSSFPPEVHDVLRFAIDNAQKAGRTQVMYGDYPPLADGSSAADYVKGIREDSDYADMAFRSFTDPVFEAVTTLGAFGARPDGQGGWAINDTFDFTETEGVGKEDAYSDVRKRLGGEDQKYNFDFTGSIPMSEEQIANQPTEFNVDNPQPMARPDLQQTTLVGTETPAPQAEPLVLEDRPEPPPTEELQPGEIKLKVAQPEPEPSAASVAPKGEVEVNELADLPIEPATPVAPKGEVEVNELADLPIEPATPVAPKGEVEVNELADLPEQRPEPAAPKPAAPAPAAPAAPAPAVARQQPIYTRTQTQPVQFTQHDVAVAAAMNFNNPDALARAGEFSSIIPNVPGAPATLGEVFSRSVGAANESLVSDYNYFAALGNALVGDDEGYDARIRSAKMFESIAADATAGFESFEEFLDQPTFGGFVTQVVAATGQVVPSAATTITAALGTGAVAALAASGAPAIAAGGLLSAGSLAMAKHLATKTGLRQLRGEALDAAQKNVLNASFNAAKALPQFSRKKAFTRGATAGAFAAEYPMMTGAIGAELEESQVDVTPETAFASFLGGVPLAGVGVFGEKLVVENLAKVALKEGGEAAGKAGTRNIFRDYASAVLAAAGKSGATELATEVVQEGSLVALRSNIDDQFTAQDAQLRLAQAAFAGFFGGAGLGGAGGTVAQTVRTAKDMLSRQRQSYESALATMQATNASFGGTAPESMVDLSAQINAVADPTYGKQAAWIPESNGRVSEIDSQIQEDNAVTEITLPNGSKVFAARVPGVGTIISKTNEGAQAVVDSKAADGVLATVLGYSDVKPDGADRAVIVKNSQGAVIWEQATDSEGQEAAERAAQQVAGATGSIDAVTIEQALKDRKTRYDEEQTREMQFDEQEARDAGMSIIEEDDAGLPVEEQVADFAIPRTETRNPDFDERFQRLLDAVPVERIQEFQDLKDSMSDSALNFILDAVENDPEFEYFFTEVDGRLAVARIQTGLGMESGNARDAVQFVIQNSRKLDKRKPRFLNISMPDGSTIPTTLPLLVSAGKRLNVRSREGLVGDGMNEVQSARQGLIRIMKELAQRGYTVNLRDGRPLTLTPADLRTADTNSARAMAAAGIDGLPSITGAGGRSIGLAEIIGARDPQPAPTRSEQNQARSSRKAGERAVQKFDRARERRRAELTDDNVAPDTIEDILAREFPEATRQQIGRDAARDAELSFDPDRLEGQSLDPEDDPLLNPEARARQDAEQRGVFTGEAADSESERIAAVRAGQEPDSARPNVYSRILIEDMPKPQGTSTRAPNRQQRRASKKAPSVVVNNGLPPIAGRILGTAMKLFSFSKTVHVISLSDLKANQAKYTEGKYANIAGWLEATVTRMDENPTQGRYLPTEDAHVIVLNDTNVEAGTATDALLGTVLAHEVGHIVFQEEYDNLMAGPKNEARRKMLWEAFKKNLENMDTIPDQYDLTKEGFEEWYADQVAAYVYDKSKSAKTGADSYFKSIAKKLRDFFTQVNRMLGGRVTQDATFAEYMDGVVGAHTANRKSIISDSDGRVLGMAEKLGVREMVQEIQAQDWFNSFKGNYEQLVQRIMRSPTYKWFSKWLATSTGYLRDLGPVGEELAQFFDNKSQSLEETGFHQAKLITFNRFTRRLGAIFALDTTTSEKDWASPEVQDVLLLAEDESVTDADLAARTLSDRTDDAAKKALEVRGLFSEIFDDYITNKATGNTWFAIRKRQNYAPRMLDFVKIEQNPEAFTEFLRQQGVDQARIDMVMESLASSEMSEDITNGVQQEDGLTESEKIAKYRKQISGREARLSPSPDQAAVRGALDQTIKDRKARLSPGMDQAAARALQDIATADMRNAISGDENGFLVPPGLAMIQYFHQVTRKVEFERRGGFDHIASLIDQLPEEERGFVDTIVQGNLGKRGQGMNSHWRTFNSIAAVHTVATTLLFTVFASVTDLAGIATRMKEFDNFDEFLKFAKIGGQAFRQSYKKDGMFDRLYDWAGFETDREMIDFAGDVGTVSMEALDNMFISVGELDFADAWARKSMSTFFDYTGLQWYTRATRVFATKMGERFIIRSATKDNFTARDERYLSELGLTREQVLENYNVETDTLDLYRPNADAVSKAIARFAEEAIIRPNPAQRPSWANNPYLTIVWQLKSYFYAYGKTVIGGIGREVKNRYNEDGDFQGGAATLLLAAGFMIPLTMVGLEMREYMKYGIQALLPGIDASGSTFRSDYMDNGEYMWEIFNRSGILGPLSIGVTSVESLKWEGLAGPLISNIPFVDAFDDTFMDGDWNRPIPVLNNIQ
jgi:hypothetical protein